jgi:hypothetical protein
VGEEVVHQGSVKQNLVRLSEPETGRVEAHHFSVPLLLLHPHSFSLSLCYDIGVEIAAATGDGGVEAVQGLAFKGLPLLFRFFL